VASIVALSSFCTCWAALTVKCGVPHTRTLCAITTLLSSVSCSVAARSSCRLPPAQLRRRMLAAEETRPLVGSAEGLPTCCRCCVSGLAPQALPPSPEIHAALRDCSNPPVQKDMCRWSRPQPLEPHADRCIYVIPNVHSVATRCFRILRGSRGCSYSASDGQLTASDLEADHQLAFFACQYALKHAGKRVGAGPRCSSASQARNAPQ
jgi:hypothetical protein